jgi:hypothetical protein
MLTVKMIESMQPCEIFATGTANDSPDGLFIANTNRPLRWVAIRGGAPDWAIYCHFAEHDEQFVRDQGDKVTFEKNIKKLVPCDDEAFKRYRY